MTQKFPELDHDPDFAPVPPTRPLFLVPLDPESDEAPVYLVVPFNFIVDHPEVETENHELEVSNVQAEIPEGVNHEHEVPSGQEEGQDGADHEHCEVPKVQEEDQAEDH